MKLRLSRKAIGVLSFTGGVLEVRKLDSQSAMEVDKFLVDEVSEEELRLAGVEKNRFNFQHPCFLYLGLYESERLVALSWMNLAERGIIEFSIIVSRSDRRRGINSAVYKSNVRLCSEIGMKHRHKVNEKNAEMLEIFRRKCDLVCRRDRHLFIFESE